jgi:putative redox protein
MEEDTLQVTVQHTTGMQFIATARTHKITVDLPESYRGNDTGPNPIELFIASLGSCIGVYVVSYLKAQSLPTAGLSVDITWEEEKSPARVGHIDAKITLPDGITPEQSVMALKAAEQCKIHNTLENKPHVCVSVVDRDEVCLP